MDKQCSHQIARIVMFLIGLVFCLLIIVLIQNTVVDYGQNCCSLWIEIPGRLFFLISFYCIAGLCGCLPFHNRLRPNFLPQPFLSWKCITSCFITIRDLWRRLSCRLPGYKGFDTISVNEDPRNITNPREESQATDTSSTHFGSWSYKRFGKSAPIISEVRSRTVLRRENDRTNFETGRSHSQQGDPQHLEKSGMFSYNFDFRSPEAVSCRSEDVFITPLSLSEESINPSSNCEDNFFTPLPLSEEDVHPSSRSENIFLFESDETEKDKDEHPKNGLVAHVDQCNIVIECDDDSNEELAESSDQCNIVLKYNELQTGNICKVRASKFSDVRDAKETLNIPLEGVSGTAVLTQGPSTDSSPSNESRKRVYEELCKLQESIKHESDEKDIFYSCPEAEPASKVKLFTKGQCNANNESVSCQNQVVNISEETRQLPESETEGDSGREDIYSLLEKGKCKRIVERRKQHDTDSLESRLEGKSTEDRCDNFYSSNTKTSENVTNEYDPCSLGISPGVSLGEERRATAGSATENRTKYLNASSSGVSGSSRKPKWSFFQFNQSVSDEEQKYDHFVKNEDFFYP